MQLLLRGDAVCSDDGAQISRVLVIQAWGCAGTLGLLTNSSGGANDSPSSGGAGSSMAAGVIHGITGMMLGGSSNAHPTTKNNDTGGMTSTIAASQKRHPSSKRSVKEDQSIALKILQTISMLVDSNSVKLTQEVLGSCILACLILGAGERISLSQSTIMTSSNSNVHAAKDKSGVTLGGAAGNIRRASLATLNQMLSNLFEKANDVIVDGSENDENNSDISYMLLVAERTITDLCAIVDNHSSGSLETKDTLSGPFCTAAKEGLVPSQTTSLALLDMIFKQCRVGIFQSIKQAKQVNNRGGDDDQIISFPYRFLRQACELVISILKLQHSRVYGPKTSSDQHATESWAATDFCFFYFATTISSSVLLEHIPSVQSENNATKKMNAMSLDLIKLLVSFVTGATDTYHESSDFEDGYIFNQTEREAFHIEQYVVIACCTLFSPCTGNRSAATDWNIHFQ
jgi:hypothetical protein